MPRYRLLVEYDGRPFVGWQRQDNGPTVQGSLEQAIAKFAHEEVHVQGAGRTDSGVHAFGQVAHVDLARAWPTDTVRDAINFHLKNVGTVADSERMEAAISVVSVENAAADFHARFSAKSRSYVYRILNRRAAPALERGRVWHVAYPLDAAAMADAARILLGRHDFSSFRAADCQAESAVKTLDVLDVTRIGDEIRISTTARSFLHSQVRIMVGTLKLVGSQRWSRDDFAQALAACDRTKAGPTAPPDGLYLDTVKY
jgi:tRNA pseudouridine38-40 synthase